jgi:hypothetical protein
MDGSIRGNLMPRLDWKFDLGHAFTIASVIVAISLAWGKIDARLQIAELRVDEARQINGKLLNEMEQMKSALWELRAEIKGTRR